MLTKYQLDKLVKKHKIDKSVILREYIQILVLNKVYSFSKSSKIFFKGGTCIHLIYKGQRFSEDLDFTVNLEEDDFLEFIKIPFKELEKENGFLIKEKKSISGKDFLLSYKNDLVNGDVFIKLDFSFREKILDPKKCIIETDFPVVFKGFINCLSEEEILSEKIRAILTRDKGRDVYDLWYLLSLGNKLNYEFINKKLKFYDLILADNKEIIDKINKLDKKTFVLDLKPFVSINEREKLGDFYEYIKQFVLNNVEY